jgi:hypothetical protein
VAVTVANGYVTLGSTLGLTFLSGDGRRNSYMQFFGGIDDVNAALGALVYRGFLDWSGADSIEIHVNDQANDGEGSGLVDTVTIAVDVLPENDPPNIAVPGSQAVVEDESVQIHGLTIFDADGSLYQDDVPGDDMLLQVSVAVVSGLLTLSSDSIAGVTFVTGDGVEDPAMIFVGSLRAVNAAMQSLVFHPSTDSNRNFVNEFLTIVVKDRAIAAGAAEGAAATFDGFSHTVVVPIDVVPSNDAPFVVTPKIHNMKLLGFDVASFELAPGGKVEVTVLVGNELSRIVMDDAGGAVIVGNDVDDFGSTSVTVEGTVTEVSDALNGMEYIRTVLFSGGDTISFRVANIDPATDEAAGPAEVFHVDLSLTQPSASPQAPILHAVSPQVVMVGLDSTLTLVGEDFDAYGAGGDLYCNFAGNANAYKLFPAVVVSSTEAHCTVNVLDSDLALPGAFLLRLTNDIDHWSNAVELFLAAPAHVVSVHPPIGGLTGGSVLRVVGTGFPSVAGLTCVFGAQEHTVPAVWNSATAVTCVTPGGVAGIGDMTVEVGFGATAWTRDGVLFEFVEDMQVFATTPSFGPVHGGGTIVVDGQHFIPHPALFCEFGDSFRRTATYLSPTQIACDTPDVPLHMVGNSVDVKIFLGARSITSMTAATFTFIPALVLAQVAPNTGGLAGGISVAVTGAGFEDVESLSCAFGAHAAAAVTFVSDTEIRCVSPSFPAETEVYVRVSVNGAHYRDATVPFFAAKAPFVDALHPAFGRLHMLYVCCSCVFFCIACLLWFSVLSLFAFFDVFAFLRVPLLWVASESESERGPSRRASPG